MNKIFQWWLNSQFEGGDYVIAGEDGWTFVEAILEKGEAFRKLKTFFDERFVVEVEGKKVESFPLAIFCYNNEGNFEEVVVEEEMNSFFDWIAASIADVSKFLNLDEFKENGSSIEIQIKENSYSGSLSMEIIVQESVDCGQEEYSQTYFFGAKNADGLFWEVRYVHPEISLKESLK